MGNTRLRVVIDTNIIFEGLTKRHSPSRTIIDAWLVDLFQAHHSNALAYEYIDVLSRKLSAQRWQQLKPILGTLLKHSRFVIIYYNWRPMSPDPGDDHVIDCAMNANAIVVTANVRDFQTAIAALGLRVMSPVEFVARLEKGGSFGSDVVV